MRLKGRHRHSEASFDMKHSIVLSAKHTIVKKLIEDANERTNQARTENVRSSLQHNHLIFWLWNTLKHVKMNLTSAESRKLGSSTIIGGSSQRKIGRKSSPIHQNWCWFFDFTTFSKRACKILTNLCTVFSHPTRHTSVLFLTKSNGGQSGTIAKNCLE